MVIRSFTKHLQSIILQRERSFRIEKHSRQLTTFPEVEFPVHFKVRLSNDPTHSTKKKKKKKKSSKKGKSYIADFTVLS